MERFMTEKSVLLALILGFALYYDVKEQKIKNFITVPGFFLGLVINFAGEGLNGLAVWLQGLVLPMLLLFPLYYINAMGAGDIKLFAATGSIMGLSFACCSFIFSVYIGGIIASAILIKRRKFWERMQNVFTYFKLMMLTKRVQVYSCKEDSSHKFIFSTAIVPGTLLQLYLSY